MRFSLNNSNFYIASIILSATLIVTALKPQDFKTCADSSFCRRNRDYADKALANPSFVSPYLLIKETITIKDGTLSGEVINNENKIHFTFEIDLLEIGAARVRINEKYPLKPRYDNVKDFALVKEPLNTLEYTEHPSQDHFTSISFGSEKRQKVIVYHSPFRVEFLVDDVPTIVLNDRGFLNFEHLRKKESSPDLVDQGDEENVVDVDAKDDKKNEEGLWEETFSGRTDTKPNGPESIGLDISFPGFAHVYGIPEHASTLSLKETRGGDGAYKEPYRLYNLDVFEYELDNPMALYGSIPFMMAHRRKATAAVLWLNAAETWIDITKSKEDRHGLSKFLHFGKSTPTSTHTHWFSESGIIDVFVFLGPSSSDIFRQYGLLTGFTALPQYFAIGYHQCRWNYLDQNDVAEVDEGFDKHDIPYDVIWLDIEHTDGKKYMTWDNAKFPDPVKMQNDIGLKGRRMVAIVDPHLKRDDNYHVYKEASDLDLFTKEPDGRVYDAWCWPGSSSWPDFTNPLTREWWSKKFAFDQYKGSTGFLFIWNDMNEPSVFNGPEITMPKDIVHHDGWEHRDLHNIYGLSYHASTAVGLSNRTNPPSRPFVLSRAFFAGSQRYGAIWTGDNFAKWDHLAISTPMLLTIGISGLPFSGADVGGFFGNPEPELLVRWYQAGAFQPFFRAHAHIDTKRREPWLAGEPYMGYIRDAIRERYALLPFWYTLFHGASTTGKPIIRPMFVVLPDDESGFSIEDQFFVGNSLLVKPVVTKGQTSIEVYLAGNEIYYDYYTFEKILGPKKVKVEAPLNKIPVFIRGGSIIPRRQRIRRSSLAMRSDPFTLLIALNKWGEATGTLYLDDGKSYEFEKGHYIHRQFMFSSGVLTSTSIASLENDDNSYAREVSSLRVERIIVLGLDKKPSKILAYHNSEPSAVNAVEFTFGGIGTVIGKSTPSTDALLIKDPKLFITKDWTIKFSN